MSTRVSRKRVILTVLLPWLVARFLYKPRVGPTREDRILDRLAFWRSMVGIVVVAIVAAMYQPEAAAAVPVMTLLKALQSGAVALSLLPLSFLVMLVLTRPGRRRLLLRGGVRLLGRVMLALLPFLVLHLLPSELIYTNPDIISVFLILMLLALPLVIIWFITFLCCTIYWAARTGFWTSEVNPLLAPIVTAALVVLLNGREMINGTANVVPPLLGLTLTIFGTATSVVLAALEYRHLRSIGYRFRNGPVPVATKRALELVARDVAAASWAPAAIPAPVTPATQQQAEAMLASIPKALLSRARHPDAGRPLVFGLLLSTQAETRANQSEIIAARYGQYLADIAVRDAEALAGLHAALRLPLAELAFPELRRSPHFTREAMHACVRALIRASGRDDVFGYCLLTLLRHELREARHETTPQRIRRTLPDSRHAVAALLAALAQVGHTSVEAAASAYHAGFGRLFRHTPIPYTPPKYGLLVLEGAWPVLDQLDEDDKHRLLAGILTVIDHDGVLTVSEVELLRTACALLHCPLPALAHPQPDQIAQDTLPP